MTSELRDNNHRDDTISYLNRIVELVSLVKEKVDNLEEKINQTQPPKRRGIFSYCRPASSSLKVHPSLINRNARLRFNPCFGYLKKRPSPRTRQCDCPQSTPNAHDSRARASSRGSANGSLQEKDSLVDDEGKKRQGMKRESSKQIRRTESVQSFFTNLVRTKPMDLFTDDPSRENESCVAINNSFMILNCVIQVPTERGSLKVVTHSEDCQCDLCRTVLTKKSKNIRLPIEQGCLIQKKLIRVATDKGFKTLVTHFENCGCSLCVKLGQGCQQIDSSLQVERHDVACPCGICQTVKSEQNTISHRSRAMEKPFSNSFLSQCDLQPLFINDDEKQGKQKDLNRKYLKKFSVGSYPGNSSQSFTPSNSLVGGLNDEFKSYVKKKRDAFKNKNPTDYKNLKLRPMTKVRSMKKVDKPGELKENQASTSKSGVKDLCSLQLGDANKKKKALVEVLNSAKKENERGTLDGDRRKPYSCIFVPSERSLGDCELSGKQNFAHGPEKTSQGKLLFDPFETKGLLRALARKKRGCLVAE